MTPLHAHTREEPFTDPGELPVIDWLDKSLIDIDPAYQRGLDRPRVAKILRGFEWASFGAIVVAPAGDGRYHCTDGQHRLEAAKQHPMVSVVPAIIVAVSGAKAEAANFIALNRDRKNISALDRYWAELAAEDEDALTISQVVNRAGVTIQRYATIDYKPGQTVAVSALRALVDTRGVIRARQVLEVLAKADLAPIKGEHIRACELLMTDDEFREDVEPEALTEAMAGDDEQMGIDAKAFAKTHRMPAARALASVWFRKSRKKRKAA
ncbi:DUF6551 family protein [Devosia aurantiaca]|uniref:ParB/Sulfiredoxin domain-containing protein n=1 Tax=Devosia aurantiaca TaxID=2714858 RepID=A0A6M1SQG7_9HYPH|nr:DUF262 domain-containing protein [Devosia aurantiaca]NGP18894.1 hypothetical protein [Devosia aurantiaca]